MEPKFECAYVRDEKFAKEFYGYYFYTRPLEVVFTIIIILSAVSNIFIYVFSQECEALGMLFLCAFLLVFRSLMFRRSVKIFLARERESNRGKYIYEKNTVTDDFLEIESSVDNAGGVRYDLSLIVRGYRTKNYICLVTKAKLVFCFDINGFSKGTPAGLIDFMKEKGVKMR